MIRLVGWDTATPVAAPRVGTATVEADVGEEVSIDLGPPDEDYSGWFCLATAPWPCPAEGCDFVAEFVTAAHLIVVWPEKDDPEMMNAAARSRNVGRDPRVVEFEVAFGPAISFFEWQARGYPVHGVRKVE